MILPGLWAEEARSLQNELAGLRRGFHRHPELGNREYETAAAVEAVLRSCGIETFRPLETAVVGTLRGALPGPTVALRADLDALPVTEATGCEFASENEGVMHACGHDVHMTAALGAAMLLARHREELPGTVKFFFQPDEEGRGGAQRMIDAGCLAGVSAVYGAHVSPDLPLGTVGFKYGRFYAASAMYHIVVKGKGSHAAEPEKGCDALAAAAEIACRLRRLNDPDPVNRLVVTTGSLHAGTASNIVADRAELKGIIRTLGPELRAATCERLKAIAAETAAEFGTAAEPEIIMSYSGVTNTDPETALAERAARALLGEEHVTVLQKPTMTTEDMGCFIAAASGSFYHIGAGCELPLHNPGFLPDERILSTAAAVHAAILYEYLNTFSER